MSQPTASHFLDRPVVRLGFLSLLLILTGWLSVDSLRRETVTYDEPLHLISGYAFWKYDDYRLQVSHGALPQRLFALPLLGDDRRLPDRSAPEWRKPDYLGLSLYPGFLYAPGTDTAALILRGRLVAVAVALLTVVAVYAWTSRLFTPAAGLIAAGCCALSPTVLAHGRLMTSDLISALCFLMSAGCAGLLLREFTWPRLAASTLCFGLLLVSKMSGPLFVLMALLMLGSKIVLRRCWPVRLAGVFRGRVRHRAGMATLAVSAALAHGVVAFAIIWCLYGWQQKPAPDWDPGLDDYSEPRAEVMHGLGPTQPIFDALGTWKVLPDAYLYGLAHTVKNSGERPSYLNGHYSSTGWWYYFPYCFLVKSSPVELAFVALGALGLARCLARRAFRRRQLVWLDRTAPLWSIVLVYGLAAVTTNLNIGHRHLLPIYLPLFVVAGAIGVWLWPRGRWARGFLGLLLAGQAAAALGIHPHYLAYFNAFAGGPRQGYLRLSDSNVDWGQDLPGLARWLEAHAAEIGAERVYVGYFGVDVPQRLGIKALPLPSVSNPRLSVADPCAYSAGTYCLSATALIGSGAGEPWSEAAERNYVRFLAELKESDRSDPPRRDDPANRKRWTDRLNRLATMQLDRLRSHLIARKPDAMVGYSILIYRVSDAELRSAILPPAN